MHNWQYIAAYIATYLAIGWVVGVALFYFVFMDHDVSMGGNGGCSPLPYFVVHMPSVPQALLYVLAMLVWPLTLVALSISAMVGIVQYIMESKNKVLPCIVKWVFGWPIFVLLYVCDNCVEHERE